MRHALVATCLAVLTCAGCSGGAGPQFDATDAASIRQAIQDLAEAFNAKDPAKTAALYAPSGVVMPPNRPVMRGRQIVEQYYVDRFNEGAGDLQIEVADLAGQGTLAYASGDFRLMLTPADGGQPHRDRGKFLWVFRQYNDRWMIEYVIFSSDFTTPPVA